MICRSFNRFDSPSRSMVVNQPDSSSARSRMEVPPCVTAVENVEARSEALYWPVWSRKR